MLEVPQPAAENIRKLADDLFYTSTGFDVVYGLESHSEGPQPIPTEQRRASPVNNIKSYSPNLSLMAYI